MIYIHEVVYSRSQSTCLYPCFFWVSYYLPYFNSYLWSTGILFTIMLSIYLFPHINFNSCLIISISLPIHTTMIWFYQEIFIASPLCFGITIKNTDMKISLSNELIFSDMYVSAFVFIRTSRQEAVSKLLSGKECWFKW